jgi:S1-C subfamily serine protease
MDRRLSPPNRRAAIPGLGSCAGAIAILLYAISFPTGFGYAGGLARAAQPQENASAASTASTHVRSAVGSETVQLADLQRRFSVVADNVAPSVVAISASVSAVDGDETVRSDELNGQRLQAILDRVTRTVGTGMVIDPDGYILTNEHVVAESEQLWVTTDDRKVYPAIVVGSDPRSDLAVLKIPATNLPTVTFAQPDTVRRGQWTIALGNPYGLAVAGEMAMSVGVVSALDRSLPKLSSKENRLYSGLIQTTAEINPGNSGGPLFDIEGNVIGVTSAVILPQKQTCGIGFAMPVTPRLMEEIATLKQGREVTYGYLGVIVSTPTTRERRSAGVRGDVGVTIDSVESKSPADGVLKPDDMLLSVNNRAVRDSDDFVAVIGATGVDQPSAITVLRSGKPVNLQVQLGKRQLPQVAVTRQSQRLHWRGLLLGPVPTNWSGGPGVGPINASSASAAAGANAAGVAAGAANIAAAAAVVKDAKVAPSGLIVLAVAADSPMIKQGITTGSIITSVAGKAVRGITDLQAILNDTPAEQCSVQLANPAPTVASTNN